LRAVHSFSPPPGRSRPSSRNEDRVIPDLSLDHPAQQSRLHFEQTAVAHPVLEYRMRHQSVHPQLVCMIKAFSPTGG